MRLSALLGLFETDAAFAAAARYGNRLSVADVAKPPAIAALHRLRGTPALVTTARFADARRYLEEARVWSPEPEQVLLFPEPDSLPYAGVNDNPETVSDRLGVLSALALGLGRPLVICSIRALMERVAPADRFREQMHVVRVADQLQPSALMRGWLELGYEPTPLVDSPGQVARRGGIVDIFPPARGSNTDAQLPYRLEFFGDEIVSIRTFNPETQRSLQRVTEVQIPPAHEGDPESRRSALLDYLPNDATVILDEPGLLEEMARELDRQAEGLRAQLVPIQHQRPGSDRPYWTWDELAARLSRRLTLVLEHDPADETIRIHHPPSYGGRLRVLLDDLLKPDSPGALRLVVSQQTERLSELLRERESMPPQVRDLAELDLTRESLVLVHGSLDQGFVAPDLGFALLTDNEIFGWSKPRRVQRRRRAAAREAFLSDLQADDWVVHVDHGIGRFRGLVVSSAEGGDREFIVLEYAAGDRLYVPVDQANRVSRYVGAGDYVPQPTRLGTGDWARAKQRARKAVRDIAKELIELHAARQDATGHAFAEDTPWQSEMEAAFPYVETPDQLAAIEAVKADMESERPMDRLLVGDVGYGKTEVAVRAAFKAVNDGYQVAVLVPTTVLAQQHFGTFQERLAAFPVCVEMLSRFLSEREQRAVLEGARNGTVDICIGTHRLIQKDVGFKNLGLVIIDEEQRFGVAHKERLKQLRREVDILTLTATPIPRTLHMSLVGVRDMSTMDTPPEDRLPIRTSVSRYDDTLIREAILRELDRGGQVYFVHNRVHGIEAMAARLARIVPEARICVGHGQLPEDQLERVMLRFSAGEFDVLVCTSIIESGLDIPNVNTIVVNNAHRFGLSQLYQLRGRVGRGAVRAYAYMLTSPDTTLTADAEQRLRMIFEATELGAGFRIAMKDLEIRGAGNLLGAEQHGQISAVGFDLYTQLLGEAVQQLRSIRSGVPPRVKALSPTSLDVPLSAYIPESYVGAEAARINSYQRIASIDEVASLGTFVDELEDRFGPLPEEVQNLVYLVGLRLRASDLGIAEISESHGEIVVRFRGQPPDDIRPIAAAMETPVKRASNQLRFARGRGQEWVVRLDALIDELGVKPPDARTTRIEGGHWPGGRSGTQPTIPVRASPHS